MRLRQDGLKHRKRFLTFSMALLSLMMMAGGGNCLDAPGRWHGVSSAGWVTTLFVEPINYQTSGNYYDGANQLRMTSYTFHHGVDISGGCTAGVYPVYAAAAGTVALAQYISDGYGTQVAIDHGFNLGDNGKYTYSFYAHMGNRVTGARYLAVSPGERVQAGQLIGYQGNDGSVYGSCQPNPGTHVDWEVRVSSTAVLHNTNMRYQGTAASQNYYTFQQLSYGDGDPQEQVVAGPWGAPEPVATNTSVPTSTPTRTPTRTPTPQPTATPGPCGMRFSDLPNTHWAYQFIADMYCRGVIGGYDDGTFRPNSPLTRGQFSKMVVLGHNWNMYNPYFATFPDVPTTHVFYQPVETVRLREIAGGYSDGTFRPNSHVTRAQATKMLVLGHGWAPHYPATPTFWDVPYEHWAYGYVETAYDRGIVSRQNDGSFGLNSEITRGELSKMLSLTLRQNYRPGDPGPRP